MKSGDWITLKGISLHGKNMIHLHGQEWLITSIGQQEGRVCIESKDKTFKHNDIPQHDVRWISTDGSGDFEVVKCEEI